MKIDGFKKYTILGPGMVARPGVPALIRKGQNDVKANLIYTANSSPAMELGAHGETLNKRKLLFYT